uniref:PB1 domain-containing protein n=1 Tax=Amphimedon queenslandica TaxID=400682 RepID=A0A1X7VIJ8_AMPQE
MPHPGISMWRLNGALPIISNFKVMEKRVLVRFGMNSRPVSFKTGESFDKDVVNLKKRISESFKNIIKDCDSESLLIQVKDEEFDDFVDLECATGIPSKGGILRDYKKHIVESPVTENTEACIHLTSKSPGIIVHYPTFPIVNGSSSHHTSSLIINSPTNRQNATTDITQLSQTESDYIQKQTTIYGKDPTKRISQ